MAPVLLAGQDRPPAQGRQPAAEAATVPGNGGGLDPASLLKPLGDSWPTYSGDYTGRRYSSPKQINQMTVKNLTLAWPPRLVAGAGSTGGFGRGGGGGAPVIVGGEGRRTSAAGRRA